MTKDAGSRVTGVRGSSGAEAYGFAIIGAGLGGLAAAMELARSGRTDFVILERAAGAGGVWRDNTYPGAACDVPSPYYSFSYAPEPGWPRRYSRQPDIFAYIRRLVGEYGLLPRIRFGAEVTAARFDAQSARWDITLGDGEVVRARFLVPAVGQLSTPALPRIPGIDSFSGSAFHSARWRHDVDLTGKRVAVIGTGASAVQFIPHVQAAATHLTVFQRSAPYLLPRLDRVYSARHRRLFRAVPATLAAERLFWWCFAELWTLQMKGNRVVSAAFRAWSALHRWRGVRDAGLREVLTPDYPMGCKRVLFSSDYYPAVSQPDVTVETDAVAEVTSDGITTASGTRHRADVLIFGTGFRAQEFCTALDIRGAGGEALAERWADGARAYLGIAVPGFPNLLMMYGPNTNLGSGSILFMLERQAVYIRRLAELADAAGADAVDVRADVDDRFDADVQRQLAHSAWTGCDSWYVAASGRISSNWPDTVSAYRRITSRVSLDDYVLLKAGQPRNASGRSRLDSRII
ncbi:flavin-containing monooxygenase [Tomitella cavernea]|uniref:flavin-containing monooxygenase n=1 Tax=Tomitella cavernea TaxID=1387982 RepID=UPI0027DBA1FB|nr:NAD(P)/FAD-dependent oxidoreductase [Tomitella cavernea]